MREVACQFGPQNSLSAVVTLPHTPGALGCIVITAGLIPKQGPYRLYALLARRLAAAGVTVMRIDLGGIGDSAVNRDLMFLGDRTLAEIRSAVDFLTGRYPVTNLTLCGLCSGAEDSFRYAESDPRVSGLVMIDPFSYRAAGWAWRHFIFRVKRRMFRALQISSPVVPRPIAGLALPQTEGALIKYNYIPHADAARIMRTLLPRNVRLHFIYTAGVSETFNHPGQFQKMFPDLDLRGRVSLDYLPWLEHTQMLAEDRETVIGRITSWFVRNLPANAAM